MHTKGTRGAGETQKKRFSKNKAAQKGKDREVLQDTLQVGEDGSRKRDRGQYEGHDVTPWPWAPLVDAAVSSQPAVFTTDSNYFFIAISNSVKIYSTSTGQIVSTLSGRTTAGEAGVTTGHSDKITALSLDPESPFQLITASLDGTLKIWDLLEATLLKTIQVGLPITHLCLHTAHPGCAFIACNKPPKKKSKADASKSRDESSLFKIFLAAKSGIAIESARTTRYLQTRRAVSMSLTASGNFLVVVGGHKVYVARVEKEHESTSRDRRSDYTKFLSPEHLTCLAMHPTEEWFATGDSKGQIRLWYCLQDEVFARPSGEKRVQTTTLHWHAHAVSSLAFTQNGAYLLSGGEEAVLVIWQVHSGKKEFVPRVGAPIQNISVSGPQGTSESRAQEYLLGLSDGTLVFVKADLLKVHRTIAKLRLDFGRPSTLPPLAVHPTTQTLLLPSSHPSSLQIYSISSSKLHSELEVSPSNRVSRPHEKPLTAAQVDLVSVSANGMWMATLDVRADPYNDFGIEIALKIWRWENTGGRWELNTRIERPHGPHRVRNVEFSPKSEGLLVSTGEDGNIKTWVERRVKAKKGEVDVYWSNRSTFSYRTLQPRQAKFSPDGSLLAVAHDQGQLSLWEVGTNVMLQTLSCVDVKDSRACAFLGKSGRYVVLSGPRALAVWDLVSGKVIKSHRFFTWHIQHVISHPCTEQFVVLQQTHQSNSIITIFSPTSSKATRQRSLPFSLKQCVLYNQNLTLAPAGFSLIGITADSALVHIGDAVEQRLDPGDYAQPLNLRASDSSHPTLWQDIFGKSALLSDGYHVERLRDPARNRKDGWMDWGILTEGGPSHLLPAARLLFEPLINNLLGIGESHSTNHNRSRKKELEEDVEMEDVQEQPQPREITRDVTGGEMDMLVELFKSVEFTASSHCSPSSPATLKPKLLTNGPLKHPRGKPNGMRPELTPSQLMASSPVITSKRSNGKDTAPSPMISTAEKAISSDPPIKIGKKRKKSVVE